MTKVVETLLEKDGFRYLSICSILFASSINSLIPWPPNSMLCRHCGLCSRKKRKINIVFLGGKGENVPKRLKNRIFLPSVSTLLSPIVALTLPTCSNYFHWFVEHFRFPVFINLQLSKHKWDKIMDMSSKNNT